MNSFDVTAHMKPLRQSFSAILAWHCTNKKSIFPFIVNWGWKGWCKGCPQKSSLQNWKHEVCQYQNMQAQTDIPFSAPLMINSVMPVKANLDSENWEIVARGIRNRNPRLKNPENNSRNSNPKTIGIRNPSSTDKDWNPVRGIRNPRLGVYNPRLSWIPSHGARCRNSMKKLRNTPWYLRTFAEYSKVFLFCVNISCNKTKSREKSLINNWLKNIVL